MIRIEPDRDKITQVKLARLKELMESGNKSAKTAYEKLYFQLYKKMPN